MSQANSKIVLDARKRAYSKADLPTPSKKSPYQFTFSKDEQVELQRRVDAVSEELREQRSALQSDIQEALSRTAD